MKHLNQLLNSLRPVCPNAIRLAALVGLLSAVPDSAIAGTIRSCRYEPGSQGFGYAAAERFNSNLAMTVEAWVYRDDLGDNQAILDHDRLHSHWFGFEPGLTFYRSGGGRAVADVTVRRHQWTHVAASYNGTHVRFYVDGEPAGVKALGNTGASHHDIAVVGKRFVGALDEVRLWSVARSHAQIRDNMEVEVRSGTGLEAVWAEGGSMETLQTIAGNPLAGGGTAQVFGMLPRELVVPRTGASMTLDGKVSSVEYAGAEQMVLRYRDGAGVTRDAVAHLVRTASNLYVGVRAARSPGADLWQSKFEVYIDTAHTSAALVGPSQVSLGVKLSDGSDEFRRGHVPFNPLTGEGGFGWNPDTPHDNAYAEQSTDSRASEFTMLDMEFRFAVSILGGWDQVDRLALGHRHPGSADLGHRYAPDLAEYIGPGTWADMRYGGTTEAPATLQLETRVVDRFDQPVPNVRLFLTDSQGLVAQSWTTSLGTALFSGVQFNPQRQLNIGYELPANSRALPTIVSGDGIAPTLISPTRVEFPPCGEPAEGSPCLYQTVQFRVDLPPGESSLTSFSPTETWPTTQVRAASPPRWIAPGVVEVQGTNLHELLNFYLVSPGCPTDPISAPQCIEGQHYHSIPEVQIVDPTRALLTMPDLPASELGSYRLAAHDLWARSGNAPSSPTSWKYAPGGLVLAPPIYPLIHGFKFHNWAGGGSWEEMTDVYGYNMFVDPLIGCAPWPHYLLWFPVYLELAGGDGSCVGMSTTSRLLEKGHYDIATWDPDALYANGHFTNGPTLVTGGTGDMFTITFPPVPDRWTFDFPCRSAATNLWGEICRNHGAQLSSEMIASQLPQLFGSGSGADRTWSEDGEPISVFHRVANDPSAYVICMTPVAGGGHCVTPFKVSYGEGLARDGNGLAMETSVVANPDANLIHVYDNNRPDVVSYIEIDTVNDRFLFPHLWDVGDRTDPTDDRQHYQGRAITAHPISIWQADHVSMPGLDLTEYIHLLIFGSAATGYHSDAKGGEWGWKNGERVDSIPGVKSMPTFGGPAGTSRQTHAFIPVETELASSVLGVLPGGDQYGFYAAHNGVQVRLRVPGSLGRQLDEVKLLRSSGLSGTTLDGLETTATLARSGVDIALGILPGKASSATFTLTNLDLDGQARYAAELVRPGPRELSYGIQLLNGGSSPLTPDLTVNLADKNAHAYGEAIFSDLEIPSKATGRFALPHWPAFDVVQFDLDLDSDGVVDKTTVLSSGTPSLTVAVEKLTIAVRYPLEFSGWVLEHSATLDGQWSPARASELVHDHEFVTARFTIGQRGFFRLRRP